MTNDHKKIKMQNYYIYIYTYSRANSRLGVGGDQVVPADLFFAVEDKPRWRTAGQGSEAAADLFSQQGKARG